MLEITKLYLFHHEQLKILLPSMIFLIKKPVDGEPPTGEATTSTEN